LMLHGLLHLAGYDHETDEGEMARREQKLRARLRLPQGLIERSARPATKLGTPGLASETWERKPRVPGPESSATSKGARR
jgi:probable rRNA maturation factor